MVIKTDTTKFVIQKFADEGSSSPFMARLFMWVLRLRDETLTDDSKRKAFDEAENFVLTELLNVRTSAQEIVATMRTHLDKISRGEIVRVKGPSIHVDENIDRAVGKQVEDFLNGAVRTLKHGMQILAKSLGVEIGFLFQKPTPFAAGVAALGKHDAPLAEYLKETRTWSERLLERRNAIEHEGWKLPKVKYSILAGTVQAQEPEISGQPATEFVSFIFDRLVCFVEEVTTHCLQLQMPAGIALTEIPMSQRESEMPVRFRVTLRSGGMPVWCIRYRQSTFEET